MGPSTDLATVIADHGTLPRAGVRAVLRLLDEGSTVPFIAPYRKEATGGLDEVQIRAVAERRDYLVDLAERRAAILASVDQQGALTPALRARLEAAATKTELEDLYAPYRPKRRTRATMARDCGLAPLADRMWRQERGEEPRRRAADFVSKGKGVADVDAALAGARDICAERLAEGAGNPKPFSYPTGVSGRVGNGA